MGETYTPSSSHFHLLPPICATGLRVGVLHCRAVHAGLRAARATEGPGHAEESAGRHVDVPTPVVFGWVQVTMETQLLLGCLY